MTVHRIHDMRIDFIDFGSYHLRIKTDVYLTPNERVRVGDKIRLFEFDGMTQELTGRNLTCEIGRIDKNPQHLKSLEYWQISLIWLDGIKSPSVN